MAKRKVVKTVTSKAVYLAEMTDVSMVASSDCCSAALKASQKAVYSVEYSVAYLVVKRVVCLAFPMADLLDDCWVS